VKRITRRRWLQDVGTLLFGAAGAVLTYVTSRCIFVPMVALRTQIYLDESLRRRIDRVAAREGRSMAEIVRLALDSYLSEEERARRPLDPATSRWLGAWAGKDTGELPSVRDQLAKRAERLQT
jgi:hypothetical protein